MIDPLAYKTTLLLHDGEDARQLSPEETRLLIDRFLPIRRGARKWKLQTMQGARILIFGQLATEITAYLAAVAEQGKGEGEATAPDDGTI